MNSRAQSVSQPLSLFEPEPRGQGRSSQVSLLLVDDRDDNLLAMETLLKPTGYYLVSVRSGQDALAEMARSSFAVVLLDVQMPEMDGFEVARLMRGRSATRHTPIIFVTAINKSSQHVFHGYEAGAVDYLFKPLDPQVLLPKIDVFVELYLQRQALEVEVLRRRRAEDDLARLNGELEAKVAARSAELQQAMAEKDVLQQQMMRVQKMDAIGRMAGGIAHDFNNLLTVILGAARLACEHPDLPIDAGEDLEAVLEAGMRAEQLIGQLSMLCRRTSPPASGIDLNSIIRDMERLLLRSLGEHIETRLELSDAPCPLRCNRGELEQVIVNLALNAGEAMRSTGGFILRTRMVEIADETSLRIGTLLPGSYVVLEASDHGEGMDETTLEHLFEPFFTTRKDQNHQGLGMASVYGIVRAHSGQIDLQSVKGKGTTFTLYFPALPVAMLDAVPLSPVPVPVHGGETVLLVEDEGPIRSICARKLRGLGYTVFTAGDGVEAEAIYLERESSIELVVTDVVMPNMDGAELAMRIRARRRELPFLFISGFTANRIAASGLSPAEIDLLQKPFDMNQFALRVRQCLDQASALQSS